MAGEAAGAVLRIVGMAREARLAQGPACVGVADLAARLRGARAAVSFGLCGALDPALRPADLVIGEAVVFAGGEIACDARLVAALAAALPAARIGKVAGGERMIGSAAGKAALAETTGAVIVDMESLAAARAAQAAGVPFVVLRAVSDGAARTLPRAAMAGFSASGGVNVGAVVASLARRPWELPALIRTAREAEAGFRALQDAAAAIDGAVDEALGAVVR
ncbi:MAG TPA: hypothetical protein VG248_12600 [Caulobacteraceae bacterium]|jgi:nucleoside phosphorylase|nr:hypothetical protein [Caulobacteraceae bacterium]